MKGIAYLFQRSTNWHEFQAVGECNCVTFVISVNCFGDLLRSE